MTTRSFPASSRQLSSPPRTSSSLPAPHPESPSAWEQALRPLVDRLEEILSRLDDSRSVKSHFTVAEFAASVGRSEYRIRAWIKAKKIHAVKAAGVGPRSRWSIPRVELERVLSTANAAE